MSEKQLELQELMKQGDMLFSLEKYEEALRYFQKALSLDSYCREAYENCGICCVMLDRCEEARDAFHRCLKLNRKQGRIHFHLGNIALLEDNPQEAKAEYSQAELLGCIVPVMYLNLASYYEDHGAFEEALQQYQKLLKAAPYDYTAMERKAELLMDLSRYAEALEAARTMVRTDIDRFEGHHILYVALILLDRCEEAWNYLNDLAKRFPDNETIMLDRVKLCGVLGRTDEALHMLEECPLDISGNIDMARMQLSLLLENQEQTKAMELIKAVPALLEDETALTMLYSMHFARGDYSQAVEYCNRIRDLGETSSQYYATWYFRPLAQKRLGKIEMAEREFAENSEKLREIVLERPERIDLNMYRALCEYQLGHYKDACRLMEYLLAVEPSSAVFHMAAAAVYEAMGDQEEAAAHREQACRLDPHVPATLL